MPRPMFFCPNGRQRPLRASRAPPLNASVVFCNRAGRLAPAASIISEEASDLLWFLTGSGTSSPTTTAATDVVYKFNLHLIHLGTCSHSDHPNNDIHQHRLRRSQPVQEPSPQKPQDLHKLE